jgi:putative PIN family toxin of toxin-antitoxin system
MIIVVVDTNVVVSAAFRDRTPEEVILFIVGSEDFEWVASSKIIAEYNEVLSRKKFNLPPSVLRQWRDIFDKCATTVESDLDIDFPRDQKDAMFLECSLAADADYLITGDTDFTGAQKLTNTTILSVSQFKQLVIDEWK